MKWQNLLRQAETELGAGPFPYRDFTTGGAWMVAQLHLRWPGTLPSPKPDYHQAGLIKYGCSFFVAGFVLALTAKLGLTALLLCGLSFYLAEVHFLFLFPLLAEGEREAYLNSIRITYELGLLHCVLNVIPIALMMLLGLFDRKDPYRAWHIGCLAIVLWYIEYRKNPGA